MLVKFVSFLKNKDNFYLNLLFLNDCMQTYISYMFPKRKRCFNVCETLNWIVFFENSFVISPGLLLDDLQTRPLRQILLFLRKNNLANQRLQTDIIFKWKRRYWQIFKSVLMYLYELHILTSTISAPICWSVI